MRCPLDRRLGELRSWSERCGEQKDRLLPPGNRTQPISHLRYGLLSCLFPSGFRTSRLWKLRLWAYQCVKVVVKANYALK